jgi:hypothetical protein
MAVLTGSTLSRCFKVKVVSTCGKRDFGAVVRSEPAAVATTGLLVNLPTIKPISPPGTTQ